MTELPIIQMRVEQFAVVVGGSRRRNRERLLATAAINRVDQEMRLSDRYAETMSRWLLRALSRRPERVVQVGPRQIDRAEVGDDFLANRFHLRATVRCVLPPPGILDGATEYLIPETTRVLSAIEPPLTRTLTRTEGVARRG